MIWYVYSVACLWTAQMKSGELDQLNSSLLLNVFLRVQSKAEENYFPFILLPFFPLFLLIVNYSALECWCI